MAGRWSELQLVLLEMILEKLDLVAHARFAAVCSSWRSAAVHNPPINKPLYLALSHNPEHLVRRFITSFIPSWKEAWFIGEGLDGWLVLLVDGRDLFLVNKGFNSIIPLPNLPQDPEYFSQRPEFWKAVLSSPPPSSSSSSSECTVVLRHSNGDNLFYCRLPSDKSFTKFLDTSEIICDIQFYKGQLYVLCKPDLIIVFDHLLDNVTKLLKHLGSFIDDDGFGIGVPRFFISENKLLIREGSPLLVFKFEQSESRVIRVNNINDNLLLLTRFYSISTTADMHKEFRRNFDRSSPNYRPIIKTTNSGIAFLDIPNGSNIGDTWPLFFFMFDQFGIKNVVSNEP